MTRHRPEPGHLLPRDDPRVVAAIAASRCLGTFDWRDIAEIVNVVLAADDELTADTHTPSPLSSSEGVCLPLSSGVTSVAP